MTVNVVLCSGFLPFQSYFFDKNVTVYTVGGTKFSNGEWNISVPDMGGVAVICQNFDEDLHARWAELWMVLQRWPKHIPCVVGIPFLGYMRQGDMCRAWVDVLRTYGPVVCIDPHEDMEHVHSVYPAWHTSITQRNIQHCVLVSPDQGRCDRVKHLADRMQCPWIGLTKVRKQGKVHLNWTYPRDAELVKNQVCVVRDDMVDSGQTLHHVGEFLHHAGARDVYAAVTHILRPRTAYVPLFSVLKDMWGGNTTAHAGTFSSSVDVLFGWWQRCLNVMDGLSPV